MSLSCVQVFVTSWTIVCQAPPFMGILSARYWSGFPCPPPRDLPNPGIERRFPALRMDSELSHQRNPRILENIPSPGELPDPEIEPGSPALQMDSLSAELPGKLYNK